MQKTLASIGNVAGYVGMLLCLLSGILRIAGMWFVLGFESGTLFVAGIGLMVFACWTLLQGMAASK